MLSILIVSYNFAESTISLLNSILQNPPTFDYEMLIYDNASNPEELKKLKAYLCSIENSKIQFHAGNENAGYGTAINRLAKKVKGEHLLLLNNDVFFTRNNLNNSFKEYLKTGAGNIISCKVRDHTGKHQNTAFYFPLLKCKGKEFASFILPGIFKPDYYGACCWFLSKEIFLKLNGFDETFFMYAEDTDFALRAQRAGIKNIQLENGEIIHNKPANEKNLNRLFRFLVHQWNGKIVFQKKYCSWFERKLLWIVSLKHCLLRLLLHPWDKKYRGLVKLYLRNRI